jgi:hypothetical protein
MQWKSGTEDCLVSPQITQIAQITAERKEKGNGDTATERRGTADERGWTPITATTDG